MSKICFSYDPKTLEYKSGRSVDDDYQPKDGETLVPLPDGCNLPAHFAGDHWEPASLDEVNRRATQSVEDYLAKHPEAKGPSASTVALNLLGEQLAKAQTTQDENKHTDTQLAIKVDMLTRSVNMLGQMIAQTNQSTPQSSKSLSQSISQSTSLSTNPSLSTKEAN